MSKSVGVGGGASPAALLSEWFERQKRVLPWRDEPTVYRVWISEIMLQQTQVATVVPYFERFLARFPAVESLAAAPEEDVLRHWAGLGYYSRARNLQKAARQVVAQGGFPADRAGWLALPGVGEYTAGAVLSIAQDRVEAILDGNVERVLSRVERIGREAGDAAFKAALWEASWRMVRAGASLRVRPSALNQALMELGALVCTPRQPRCLLCPIQEHCRARRDGVQEQYPPRRKPKEWVDVREEVHCVLDGAGRVLVERRPPGEWRAGLWDLPSRKPRWSGLRAEGEIEVRLVVTRHRVRRRVHVWRTEGAGAPGAGGASGKFGAAEPGAEPEAGAGRGEELRWIDPAAPDVPVGSSLVKSVRGALGRPRE